MHGNCLASDPPILRCLSSSAHKGFSILSLFCMHNRNKKTNTKNEKKEKSCGVRMGWGHFVFFDPQKKLTIVDPAEKSHSHLTRSQSCMRWWKAAFGSYSINQYAQKKCQVVKSPTYQSLFTCSQLFLDRVFRSNTYFLRFYRKVKKEKKKKEGGSVPAQKKKKKT